MKTVEAVLNGVVQNVRRAADSKKFCVDIFFQECMHVLVSFPLQASKISICVACRKCHEFFLDPVLVEDIFKQICNGRGSFVFGAAQIQQSDLDSALQMVELLDRYRK